MTIIVNTLSLQRLLVGICALVVLLVAVIWDTSITLHQRVTVQPSSDVVGHHGWYRTNDGARVEVNFPISSAKENKKAIEEAVGLEQMLEREGFVPIETVETAPTEVIFYVSYSANNKLFVQCGSEWQRTIRSYSDKKTKTLATQCIEGIQPEN